MLDQLEMVIRRYHHIAPHAGTEMTLNQAEQLGEWLEFQVGRIAASLLDRPAFRRRVRWSIEQLTGEFEGPERQAVIAVDQALVRCAQALSAIARKEEIWQQLLQLGPYGGQIPEGDPSALDPPSENHQSAPLPLGLAQVEYFAQRPWRDLVSAWDFFHPTVHFNFQDQEKPQWANFLPYANRRLRVPGDFVIRCMEIRITTWRDELQKFWVRCDTARRNAGTDLKPEWDELQECWSDLNSHFKSLRALCFEGSEARLRDSCIALFQIFAGFHQDVDVGWLGPAAEMMAGAADIPYRVTGMRQWEVPERAVEALIDIANLIRRPQAPEDLIEEMKSTKPLVFIEEQREGFLNGMSINASEQTNWHKADLQWEFLWTLALNQA